MDHRVGARAQGLGGVQRVPRRAIDLGDRFVIAPIVWFDALGAGDAGGKGAHLDVLRRGGLPVPDGIVVTTTAYRLAMEEAGSRPAGRRAHRRVCQRRRCRRARRRHPGLAHQLLTPPPAPRPAGRSSSGRSTSAPTSSAG